MRLQILSGTCDLRRRIAASLLTFLRLLVLLPATLWLNDGPARAASKLESTDDLILTVLARKALLDDRDLAPLNLGVRVQQRVATLWGPVPSEATAQRAIAMLSVLPELVRIQNAMQIADENALVSVPRPMPVPRPSAPPPGTLTGRAPEAVVQPTPSVPSASAIPEETWQATRPGQDPRMPDHREFEVVLPSLRLPTPPLSDPAAAALDRAIDKSTRDLRRNQRFQGIDVQVKDAHVTLAGDPSPALYDFAHAVSHLPGVKRVIIKERR